MSSQSLSVNKVCASLLMVVYGLYLNPLHAEEVVPAKVQSDAQVNVWVDKAPLSLLVSQLATITGREASIDGSLDGEVSGRFNGSMSDALDTISEQFPVLFDMDKETLAAIPAADRSTATIGLGESGVNDDLSALIASGQLSGNEVELRESDIVVSGHPAFVKRMAESATRVIADAKNDPSVTEDMAAQTVTIADTASQAIAESADSEDLIPNASAESASVSKPIRWVTDIPGYETF